jgi:hypothetical protein
MFLGYLFPRPPAKAPHAIQISRCGVQNESWGGLRRTVEQAFRLPCRYSYRHSPKNVGTDADVAT